MDFAALPEERSAHYPQAAPYADRHNGQLTNPQRSQHAQDVAEHLPNDVRDRSVGIHHRGMRLSGPVDARQRKSTSSTTMKQPGANDDHAAAAPATADRRQADYFLRLLTQGCRRIDHQIDKYRRAITSSEARGDVDYAQGVWGMIRIEEQDRQILEGLIDRLRRRFVLRATGEVPR